MDVASVNNNWVDSYLDALLSAGLSTEYARKASEEKEVSEKDADNNIAAKYYVQQILGMDEGSIQQAWTKMAHRGSATGERDARLEYLSWRVWGMKRKHALLTEQALADGAETDVVAADVEDTDLSDISPIPDHSTLPVAAAAEALGAPGLRPLRVTTVTRAPSDASADGVTSPLGSPDRVAAPITNPQLTKQRVPKLYCVLISMHGLVRGEHMELGKDPDTGGQVKYVVELAKALSRHPAVHRVDLLTRLIKDPKVDPSYGAPLEPLTEAEGKHGGAYIVRIPCGPVDQYIRKEHLWPHIREFCDNALTHVTRTMGRLMTAGEPCELYDIHGHYADAGEAAALISYTLGVDMVLTGHSLGRNKLDHLLKSGTMSRKEIEAGYAISRRIEGEERALDAASVVFTSTLQEVKDQWGLYDGYDPQLERVFHQRPRRGRHVPRMMVVPPGLDFSNLKVSCPTDPWDAAASAKPARISSASGLSAMDDLSSSKDQTDGPLSPRSQALSAMSPRTPVVHEDPPIWQEIFKFLRNPRKPVILAMSRPDAKKNITTLVRAYGSNRALRDIANLVLIMGNREVIDSMASGSQKVMESVLKLIDRYNLYGSVAYPKRHTQDDISDIYLLPAATRGVFVNIALQEPFGLTLIEAAAHGVPIVATKNGGPVDIVRTLKNGVVVDPTDDTKVADEILKMLTDPSLWDEKAANGVANIHAYMWSSHCLKCLEIIEGEKVRVHQRKKNAALSTFSSCLDDFALLVSPSAAQAIANSQGGSFSASSPRASFMDATFSTSAPNDDSSVSLSGAAAAPAGAMSPSAALSDLSRSSVPAGGTDLGRNFSLPEPGSGITPAAAARMAAGLQDKYVVFVLDSRDTAKRIAQQLARKGNALKSLTAGMGLGLCSVYGLTDTSALLKGNNIDIGQFDFAITNAGSEIWYTASDSPRLDEGFETAVDSHWDKQVVVRLIEAAMRQKTFLASATVKTSAAAGAVAAGGAGVAATVAAAGRGGVTAGIASVASGALPLPEVKVDADTGSWHVVLELAPGAGEGDTLMPPAEQLALMGRLKRRFRRSGVRCQLMAQMENSTVNIHITPVRASRALALRYLAHRHKVSLPSILLVACPRLLEVGKGGVLESGIFAASDADDLVAGCQGVMLLPGDASTAAGGSSSTPGAAKAGYPVDLSVHTHSDRVKVLKKPTEGVAAS